MKLKSLLLLIPLLMLSSCDTPLQQTPEKWVQDEVIAEVFQDEEKPYGLIVKSEAILSSFEDLNDGEMAYVHKGSNGELGMVVSVSMQVIEKSDSDYMVKTEYLGFIGWHVEYGLFNLSGNDNHITAYQIIDLDIAMSVDALEILLLTLLIG